MLDQLFSALLLSFTDTHPSAELLIITRSRDNAKPAKAASVPTPQESEALREAWHGLLLKYGISRTIILASTFRSGSSHIAELFKVAGFDELMLEKFNITHKLSWHIAFEDKVALLENIVATACESTLNFKLMWPHRTYIAHGLGIGYDMVSEFNQIFPNASWIWVRRHDKIRQAISYWRATRTGRWHVYQRPEEGEPRPPFDRAAIMECLHGIEQDDRLWGIFMEKAGIQPMIIDYASDAGGSDDAVKSIAARLGLPTHKPFATTELLRQSDSYSDEVREILLRDLF